jgi:hypothetical protein
MSGLGAGCVALGTRTGALADADAETETLATGTGCGVPLQRHPAASPIVVIPHGTRTGHRLRFMRAS